MQKKEVVTLGFSVTLIISLFILNTVVPSIYAQSTLSNQSEELKFEEAIPVHGCEGCKCEKNGEDLGVASCVITDINDWENFRIAPPLPKIDFQHEIVIAVFQGEKPTGGYKIEITKMVESDKNLIVYVETTSPCHNEEVTEALTYPCHIVKTKMTNKEVIFKVSKKDKHCE